MNIETNHLISLPDGTSAPEGYLPIPNDLLKVAQRALGNQLGIYVSKTSGGKLSKWAAKQRKQKRKMAAESKKRNRRK